MAEAYGSRSTLYKRRMGIPRQLGRLFPRRVGWLDADAAMAEEMAR